MSENQPTDKTPWAIARKAYGATLGTTSREGAREACEEWAELDEDSQRFIQARLTYLQIMAQRVNIKALGVLGLLLQEGEGIKRQRQIVRKLDAIAALLSGGEGADHDDDEEPPEEDEAQGAVSEPMPPEEQAPARPVKLRPSTSRVGGRFAKKPQGEEVEDKTGAARKIACPVCAVDPGEPCLFGAREVPVGMVHVRRAQAVGKPGPDAADDDA